VRIPLGMKFFEPAQLAQATLDKYVPQDATPQQHQKPYHPRSEHSKRVRTVHYCKACEKRRDTTSVSPQNQLTIVASAFVPQRKARNKPTLIRPKTVLAEMPKVSQSKRHKNNLAIDHQQITKIKDGKSN
jgi:hypothetical protein